MPRPTNTFMLISLIKRRRVRVAVGLETELNEAPATDTGRCTVLILGGCEVHPEDGGI